MPTKEKESNSMKKKSGKGAISYMSHPLYFSGLRAQIAADVELKEQKNLPIDPKHTSTVPSATTRKRCSHTSRQIINMPT
jgi:hypothetical protein